MVFWILDGMMGFIFLFGRILDEYLVGWFSGGLGFEIGNEKEFVFGVDSFDVFFVKKFLGKVGFCYYSYVIFGRSDLDGD